MPRTLGESPIRGMTATDGAAIDTAVCDAAAVALLISVVVYLASRLIGGRIGA